MQFNEFQRRLHSCHIDEQTKYLLAHMFEVQAELNKQLDACASIVASMAQTISNVVTLHGETQNKLKQLMEFGRVDGVEVHSVRNDPEDDE